MAFLPPSGGVFRLSLLGVIAGYPMQTVMRFSRYGAEFGNKKSPHNNLNLTIPSGMALVRVRYVAIRKLKTCSAALCKRALLKIRHFRQGARKNNENFGEKRELDDSFCLFVFYQQRLIGFQLHICQPYPFPPPGAAISTHSA